MQGQTVAAPDTAAPDTAALMLRRRLDGPARDSSTPRLATGTCEAPSRRRGPHGSGVDRLASARTGYHFQLSGDVAVGITLIP